MLREKSDEISHIEELEILSEVCVIACVEKHLPVKAFKAYLLERDWGSGYVLGEILPLLLASGKDADRPIDTES